MCSLKVVVFWGTDGFGYNSINIDDITRKSAWDTVIGNSNEFFGVSTLSYRCTKFFNICYSSEIR